MANRTASEEASPKRPGARKLGNNRHTLRGYYAMGREVIRRAQKRSDPLPRAEIIRNLAKEYECQVCEVQRAHKLARMINEDELKKLMSLRFPNGEPITPSHIMIVLSFEKGKMLTWLEKAAAEGWSIRQLEGRVWWDKAGQPSGEAGTEARNRNRGRPCDEPRTLQEGLASLARQTASWLKFAETSWRTDAPWWDEKPRSKRKFAALEVRAEQVLASLRELLRRAKELEGRVEKSLELPRADRAPAKEGTRRKA